jgi:hypothetical protein
MQETKTIFSTWSEYKVFQANLFLIVIELPGVKLQVHLTKQLGGYICFTKGQGI